MKKVIIILFFSILSNSCKSQRHDAVEIALEKCVNNVTTEYCKNILDCRIDFYPFIIEIENSLIKSGLLRGNSKSSYLKFIEESLKDENKKSFEGGFKKIRILMYENKFDPTDFELVNGIIKGCPYQILKENKLPEESLLYNQFITIDKLEATGMIDERILYSFIKDVNSKDFNKTVYRGPILLLTYKIMQNRYDKE